MRFCKQICKATTLFKDRISVHRLNGLVDCQVFNKDDHFLKEWNISETVSMSINFCKIIIIIFFLKVSSYAVVNFHKIQFLNCFLLKKPHYLFTKVLVTCQF